MRPSIQISTETRALADRLMQAAVGDVVTYSDLSAALGADVHRRRYLLMQAIKAANAETGALFASVRRIGYQRLAANEAHIVGAAARRRIRSTTRCA